MSPQDDWKGDHLIRGVRPDARQKASVTASAAFGLKARIAAASQAQEPAPATPRKGLGGQMLAGIAEAEARRRAATGPAEGTDSKGRKR